MWSARRFPNLSATRATTRQVADGCAGIARRCSPSSAKELTTEFRLSKRRAGTSASSSATTTALSATQLSTGSRGWNTRLRTYLTLVYTEPFSYPFAGAQNSTRNGYAPDVTNRPPDAVEQRLGPLDGIRLGEVRIRMRERRHQILDLPRRPGLPLSVPHSTRETRSPASPPAWLQTSTSP